MASVTAIILTRNEEKNIADCLKSLAGFAECCVVVDSMSTDHTAQIAQSLGAQVYFHEFENYARQFNWGIDHCDIQTKWTLRIDADERFTPDLCRELEEIMAAHDVDDVNGVVMEAWLYFMGRCMRHGCRNKRKLMLFKTGIGRIEDRRMDERTVLSAGEAVCARNRFIHYDFKNLSDYIRKLNWYATREMQDYIEFTQGKRVIDDGHDAALSAVRKKKFGFYYKLPKFWRCWMLFIYNYIFRLGFLDGREGFLYNWLYHRFYRTLVDAKILEQERTNAPFEKTGAL